MKLNENLRLRILNDSKFSLDLAVIITRKSEEPLKQITLEAQAKRESNILLLPNYIDAYKELGYSEEDIFEKEPAE